MPNDPWEPIGVGQRRDEITLRRIDADHPLDFFRGRDSAGQYLLVLQTDQAEATQIRPPSFAGIDISVRPRFPTGSELVLTLHATDELDVFRALCADLMAVTRQFVRGDDGGAQAAVLARLLHWQQMLRRLANDRLDPSKVIGLFGELLVLRDEFLTRLDPTAAIAAWRGPFSDKQDFLYGSWMVEVKTQIATAERKVRISSPEQLNSGSSEILLCHQTLSVVGPEEPDGSTLNSLARGIADSLKAASPLAFDGFVSALVAAGYVERIEYDASTWTLNSRSYFHVRDGFPRLTPTLLPPGVENVQYAIRIDSCDAFRVEESQAAHWVFNGNDGN